MGVMADAAAIGFTRGSLTVDAASATGACSLSRIGDRHHPPARAALEPVQRPEMAPEQCKRGSYSDKYGPQDLSHGLTSPGQVPCPARSAVTGSGSEIILLAVDKAFSAS